MDLWKFCNFGRFYQFSSLSLVDKGYLAPVWGDAGLSGEKLHGQQIKVLMLRIGLYIKPPKSTFSIRTFNEEIDEMRA